MSTSIGSSNIGPQAETTHGRPPARFVTATSLFDGHDASINIMRRILQANGAEVIHLGHNRSVDEIVSAAIQEDADAIAISSYQGGHMEFFRYAIDKLKEYGSAHIQVFGGGGGVIITAEAKALEAYGVARIYSPEDGQTLGLEGMVSDMVRVVESRRCPRPADIPEQVGEGDRGALARLISALESDTLAEKAGQQLPAMPRLRRARAPVLGITGTGGSGKSSLTDEIVRRFRIDYRDELKIALIAIDPTRRKTGGALLGDRIRMNAIHHPNIYMRSIATRDATGVVPECLPEIVAAVQLADFDLIMIETPGIGQGDAGIVPYCDLSLYVMTPEFGAQSQLEKIDMLDHADVVAINKFDRHGADDAYRDVCKQVRANREAFDRQPEDMPVFGTIASRFNDDGVSGLYGTLRGLLQGQGLRGEPGGLAGGAGRKSSAARAIVPSDRQRYLAEIAQAARGYRRDAREHARLARECQQLRESIRMLRDSGSEDLAAIETLLAERDAQLAPHARALLERWPRLRDQFAGAEGVFTVAGRDLRVALERQSLSGTKVPRVALPRYEDQGELLRWLLMENLPGEFPFTAGVFPFKREDEQPTRMFAGEGDAFRTNRRFKTLSAHSTAKRLSTAFDSVTLYGHDPAERPDIYGKIGNAGVSICTVEDMQALYEGFDLCDPGTSVSMTINGPAPIILAFFFNAAFDQQIARFERDNGRRPNDEDMERIRSWTLANVRGTVQADILKEDQGQNTCLFSTEFSLKLMGDIQEYFIRNKVRNFYSVSISGYHIAEAGANPITQLAFTLANGFTYVESYLARGMQIDDFAPRLSFFFSNGMDPEYSVIGRVARRIWAVAMRERYGANTQSQKLKYHIQTSGRSLHAQEMAFNDIRTTLQALVAVYDNCNSLHTNAYDEAVTTPSEESVRRALAIQLIINNEWGLALNENPNQGSFIIEQLTDLVEEAVLCEFERLSQRGGVLGAMETRYQRSKIQDESMLYEQRKHDGSLPIVGVNTFVAAGTTAAPAPIELARSTDAEKQSQLTRLRDFQSRARQHSGQALERVRQAAVNDDNVFAQLVDAARYCSLGQLTEALFEVGGQYRRNM